MTTQIKNLEQYKNLYQQSVDNPEEFWEKEALTFEWDTPFDKVCEWDFTEPNVKWFLNGKTNITINCLDRHLEKRGDQVAIIWEPNEIGAEHRSITYLQLYHEVCKMANALKSLGIQKGDRVVFYMPMVPELSIGVLAWL